MLSPFCIGFPKVETIFISNLPSLANSMMNGLLVCVIDDTGARDFGQ